MTNARQFGVNLSMLVLPCSLLVQDGGYCLPLRWVDSWLPTYLSSFFPSNRDKILQRKSNRQPLHLQMGTSPLSYGSLG